MEIPKDEIVRLLRERGQSDQAESAGRELPDTVDPERDSGVLSRFGLEPQDLIGMLGDRLPGGLGDRLGGL
jgi:hypothetical protein